MEDSEPEPGTAAQEYDRIGLVDFDFNQFALERTSKLNASYDFPYLKLLQKLWPGVWMDQLSQLNEKIDSDNKIGKSTATNTKRYKKVANVSQQEWWIFISIIISAAPHGKGGAHLWEKEKHREERTETDPINYGPDGKNIMPEYRFNQIKSVFPWSFQNKEAEKKGDPWSMVLLLVDGFNDNRHEWIAASVKKVLDELMSAWISCDRRVI